MSTEIALRALRKTYKDGTVALGGVDLVCPRSKTTALVGPSGSGKSTILKIVAGLLDATGGTILFDGRDVTDLPPEKRNIGMVFQSYALFPNMTVLQNVEFGLLVRKSPEAERRRRAREALETVQIGALADRRIHQLSGGQQQRVALARAVVFKPDILLLDEPLSALDAKIRHELRAELARLLRDFAITSIYVTHDQQEAMSLGDQVVVLDRGAIMQAGTPFDVYTRPANSFVANFIGNANLFPVRIETDHATGIRIQLAFADLSVPAEQAALLWPGLQAGPARLLCRPQDVMIVPAAEAHTEIVVDEALFLGDRLRLGGRTKGGERVHVEAHTRTRVGIGDTIPIAINMEHAHLLPPAG